MLKKLVLVTTYRCDLHCQHCSQGVPHQQVDFPIELLDKLLADALPFGARHVGLTGGEPHLHPQFEKIVETIVKYGFTWGLSSHGLRTEPYLPLMEKYREQFKSVGLSLDGATPEIHDEIRGQKGAFEKVISSAKLYVQKGFTVWMKTSLNQKNKGHVEELMRLAQTLRATGIMFAGTIPTAWNQHLVLSDSESIQLYQTIMALRDKFSVKTDVASALYTSGGVNFCPILNLSELTVNPWGNVDFCCDINFQEKATIGSLRDGSFANLLQGWLKQSVNLQLKRVEKIASGSIGERFDTCAYCYSYFS